MKKNIIKDKSYDFAIDIIHFYKFLIYNKKEFVIAKQILKSGTSVGANVEEAIGGQSRKDFICKMSIAYKEARETNYWLKLLKDTNTVNEDRIMPLINKSNEIQRILGAIQMTTQNNS